MSLLTLSMDIPSIGGLSAQLSRMVAALDATRIVDEAGAIVLYNIQQRYLAETDPYGSKWKPSKAGLERRARGGTGTLFDTGNLFRSIQLARTSDTEREIMTDVEYAPFVQGLPIPRIFLDFAAEDLTAVEQLLARRVAEALT